MTDRKDKLDLIADQAERLDGDEAVQAWRRLCRALRQMTEPQAPPPRFNHMLHHLWIAATNEHS